MAENVDPHTGTETPSPEQTVDESRALRPLGPGLRRRSDNTITLEEYDSEQDFDMSSGSHSARRGYYEENGEADGEEESEEGEQDLRGFGCFNLCVVCKVDMGDCNPRQYCRKTYCPFDDGGVETDDEENQDDEENERQVTIDVRTRITARKGAVSLDLTTVESAAPKVLRL